MPRERWMQGSASTGTIAFAGMARSYRKRGHLRGRGAPRGDIQGVPPCWYTTRPSRRGPPARKAVRGPVGGGHAPESGGCKETSRPERSLSGAWPPPTGSAAISAVVAHHGGYTRGPPLLVRHAAEPPRATGPRGGPRPCRRGPCPRKRWMQGNVSTGTIAFGGMARSYRKRGHLRGRGAPRGIYKGSRLVGTPRGRAAAGHRPERRPVAL